MTSVTSEGKDLADLGFGKLLNWGFRFCKYIMQFMFHQQKTLDIVDPSRISQPGYLAPV